MSRKINSQNVMFKIPENHLTFSFHNSSLLKQVKIATIKKASENNQVHYQILPSAMLSGKFLIEIQIVEIGKLIKSFFCTALGVMAVTCSGATVSSLQQTPPAPHSPGPGISGVQCISNNPNYLRN